VSQSASRDRLNGLPSREHAQALRELFADCRARLAPEPVGDFSGQKSEAARFCQVMPDSGELACRIVARAFEHGVALRTRAQGHSLNGSSLPRIGELSFSAANLRLVRFEEPGSVTVGCGVVLWILQHLLRRHGFDLPVFNDGYPGPSVGGFLASGGFGPRSAAFGGFWNNVIDVGLIDGRGHLRRIAPSDPLFPWLFGSMGQLGLFVDARLAIIPREPHSSPPYPRGTQLIAPELVAPAVPGEFAIEGDERLFWFTLFVPDESLDEAHRALRALEQRHSGALRFQERYRYPIRMREVVAPLLYPFARSFTATGAWGWLTDSSSERLARLREFDAEFMELTAARSDYRRYVQSEMASGPGIYQRCFGAQIYRHFLALKSQLDPASLFNRGSVFVFPASLPADPTHPEPDPRALGR